MNHEKAPPEDVSFLCKLHQKSAQAFCTQEGCQEKILCYVCIRSSHPHPEDKYQNIIDIFKASSDNPNKTPGDRTLEQFKSSSQNIEKGFKQLKTELSWYEKMTKEIETSFSSTNINPEIVSAIKSEVRNLVPKDSTSNTIVDGPELSQLINRFLKLGSTGQINPTDREKVLTLQKKTEQLIIDFTKKFEQLTAELSTVTGIKYPIEGSHHHKKSKTNTPSQPTQYAPKASIKTAEDNNEGLKGKEKSADFSNFKKNSSGFTGSPTSASAMSIEKPAQFGENPMSKKTGIEPFEDKMEIIPITENDFKRMTSAPKTKIALGANEKADKEKSEIEALRTEIKKFISSGRKEKLHVVEDWLQKAANIKSLDSDTKAILDHQKAVIEAYNKTLKGTDISNISKDAVKFLTDLNTKTKKRSLQEFLQSIQKQKTAHLDEYSNWLEEPKMFALHKQMSESRIDFSKEENELAEHLVNYISTWREIEPKLDATRSEKLQVSELEAMIQRLWPFRVKIPQLERLLNLYFNSKELKVTVKYFLARFSQLDLERCNLFKEETKESEVAVISQHCKEISLENAVNVKNKVLTLVPKVDMGPEFENFLEKIESSEKSRKSVVEILKVKKPMTELSVATEIQMIHCIHQLYFDEMIEFRAWYIRHKQNQNAENKKAGNSFDFSYLMQASSAIAMCQKRPSDDNKMQIEKQDSEKSTKVSSQKPNGMLSHDAVRWIAEAANHMAQCLQAQGLSAKAKEILEQLARFESNQQQHLVLLSMLCKSNTSTLLRHYENGGSGVLESVLAKGLAMKSALNEEAKGILDYLNTISWYISTNLKMKGQSQTLELLEDSLANLKQRNLSVNGNSLAMKRKERVDRFKELRAEVLGLEKIDWESNSSEIVKKLERLDKTYNELNVEDEHTHHIIQEKLRMSRQGVQWPVAQAQHGISKEDVEKSKVLTLADLTNILAELLTDKLKGKGFSEKLIEVKASLLKNYDSESSQLAILNSSLFQNDQKQKQKHSDLLSLLSAVDSSDSCKAVLHWILVAAVILKARKGTFRTFEKLRKLSRSVLKSGVVQATSALYQNFMKAYLRAKSLNSELIFVRGVIKAQKKTELSKRKFQPMNAEYLKGLLNRIKHGRLFAIALRKRINKVLKRSGKYDKEFEDLMQRYLSGNRPLPSEYNKFVKKIDSSLCISYILDKKIEETLEKEKALKKELKDLDSDNITPNALYQKMYNFCFKSYPEHIIFSKKSEKFIAGFKRYQPIWEEYLNINRLQDKAPLDQISNLRKQIEEFAATSLSKKKNLFKAGIHQIRKLLCRLRIFLIQNGVKGVNKEIKISMEQIMMLIRDINDLNAERKNSFQSKEMSFISDFKKKIDATLVDINKAGSTNELDTVIKKTAQKFHGAIDFTQEFEARREELKNAIAMVQSSIMPTPTTEKTSVSKSETVNVPKQEKPEKLEKPEKPERLEKPIKKTVMIDLELEPAIESEPFEILEPIGLEPIHLDRLELKPTPTKHAVIMSQVKVEGKEKASASKSSNVVMIIESDEENERKSLPLQLASEPSQEFLIIDDIEPGLTKKVKDNTGNHISVGSGLLSVTSLKNTAYKVNSIIEKEAKIRNQRKDYLRHLRDIVKGIQAIAQEDGFQRGEAYWTEKFAQLLPKADELKSVLGLLMEEFDLDFFKKLIHSSWDELKDLEKSAHEELERGKANNLNAKKIILRLTRPLKSSARKTVA